MNGHGTDLWFPPLVLLCLLRFLRLLRLLLLPTSLASLAPRSLLDRLPACSLPPLCALKCGLVESTEASTTFLACHRYDAQQRSAYRLLAAHGTWPTADCKGLWSIAFMQRFAADLGRLSYRVHRCEFWPPLLLGPGTYKTRVLPVVCVNVRRRPFWQQLL